jgi:hypothetical protein
VLSLKTEDVELAIGGDKKKLLGLYAEIDANDNLLAINKADQKLFTSCEIHPDFAGEGEAYLVGLAVTDQPASLGTEPLKFAALSRPNVFSSACATIAEATKSGMIAAFTSFFKADKPKELVTPPTPPAPANDNAFDVERFAAVMGEQVAAAVKPSNDAVAALGARFDALEAKLATTEQPRSFKRAPAAGGKGTVVTDC